MLDEIVLKARPRGRTVCIECDPSDVISLVEHAKVGSQTLVVLFAQWNSNGKLIRRRSSKHNAQGRDTLIIHVKPCIVRPSIDGVKSAFQAVHDRAVCEIQLIADQYTSLSCEAVSLGVSLALIVGRHIAFDTYTLVVGGAVLAEGLWESPLTRTIRDELVESGVSLDDAQKHWQPFNPINNTAAVKNAQSVLVQVAMKDRLVPAASQLQLAKALKTANPNTIIRHIDKGHAATALQFYTS